MKSNDLNIKKKIMFIKDEDYNYLTYNILIVLDHFKCYTQNKTFIGYMKLAFLINCLTSDADTNLFVEAMKAEKNTQSDLFLYENLLRVYTKSKLMQGHVKRLLFALKRKNIIDILPDRFSSVGAYMFPNGEMLSILHDNMFNEEYERIKKIQMAYPRLRSIKYESFLKKVFIENGVGKWED